MYYIKVFKFTDISEVEKGLNAFYQEVQEKGHRIMYSTFKMTDHGAVHAIITINNAKRHE